MNPGECEHVGRVTVSVLAKGAAVGRRAQSRVGVSAYLPLSPAFKIHKPGLRTPSSLLHPIKVPI